MYSQNNEDEFIAKAIGRKVKTVLDIGANDGITFSNSKYFIERGAKAVLVEPSPLVFGRLKDLYKGVKKVKLYNFAITDKVGTTEFYDSLTHKGEDDHALASTCKLEETHRWARTNDFKKTKVATTTFNTVDDFPFYDVVSIDAEGYDLEILKQIPVSKIGILCIEWNGKQDVKNAILDYTKGQLLHANGENLIIKCEQ